MHAYDVSRRPSYPPIRSVRPVQNPQGGPSATPIFDALYAEYVQSYRTPPGDRTGEEDLGFVAFGNLPHSTGSHAYVAYSVGAYGLRHGAGQQHAQWQRIGVVGRQGNGPQHVPAALPPAPRRGV
ncbi:hypothetical protein [Streptomyces sp. NPDC046985]|uniref:hypothetical protein n=1 Tax=Streptomyces sp. NPDC046985 TaxID=3155377 RepID=UPI0033C314F0